MVQPGNPRTQVAVAAVSSFPRLTLRTQELFETTALAIKFQKSSNITLFLSFQIHKQANGAAMIDAVMFDLLEENGVLV